jgi:hypothetical protein
MTNSQAFLSGLACFLMGGYLGWLVFGDSTLEKGNLFEGLNVVIAASSAVALGFIGYQANKLVRSSHDEKRSKEFNEGRILLHYLSPELQAMSLIAATVHHVLSAEGSFDAFSSRRQAREYISQKLNGFSFPETVESRDRLGVLPNALGDSLAQLLGVSKHLRRVAANEAAEDSPGTRYDVVTGEVLEPTFANDECRETFSLGFKLLLGGTKLAMDELERAMEAARVMRETKI